MSNKTLISSAHKVMVFEGDDQLRVIALETRHSLSEIQRGEEQHRKDMEASKTSPKNMNRVRTTAKGSSIRTAKGSSFVFQNRLARIDWSSLQNIDIDRTIREADIDALETVLHTIAFGDIQGEDRRNLTDVNLVKIFCLAQLLVEYLLHVQGLLTDQNTELLRLNDIAEQENERVRNLFLWHRNVLLQTRHELKLVKKTLKKYELMPKTRGKNLLQNFQTNQPQIKSEMGLTKRAHIHQLRAKHQVDDLRGEIQKLKGATSDVNRGIGNKYKEENLRVYSQSSVSSSADSYAICSTRVHSPTRPKPPRPLTLETLETQENRTKDDSIFMFPERTLPTSEEKKPADQLSNVEKDPIAFSMRKEKRVPSPGARLAKDARKNGALLALARPTFGRRRTQAESSHEKPSEQELFSDPEHYRPSMSVAKQSSRRVPWKENQEDCSERMNKSCKERTNSPAAEKCKPRSAEMSTTGGKLQNKPEWDASSAREEKRYQKQLPICEHQDEKLNRGKIGKRTSSEGARSCKLGSQCSYLHKLETPTENIAPKLLDFSKKEGNVRPSSSTIHRVRSILSKWKENKQNRGVQYKPCGLLTTPAQYFHTRPPYKPGLCCAPAVHPYFRLGQENPQLQPSTSLHMAVLNSIPDLRDVSNNQPLNNSILSPKEHTVQRLATITRELGKYFPHGKPTESSREENEPSSMWTASIEAEDEIDEHTPLDEHRKVHRIQEIDETAASDIAKERPSLPILERQKWSHVAKCPCPEVAVGNPQREIVNEFDGQLCEELRKFGISSNTNSISDTTYDSISNALRKQQSQRISHVHDNERKLLELERGAIVLQTQSDHTNSVLVRSHQVYPNICNLESIADEEEEQNPGRGEQSSECSYLSDGFQEAEMHDKNQARTRFMYTNSQKAGSKGNIDLISSPQRRTHKASRLCSPLNSTWTSRESVEDKEEDGESLGLGEWESDDDT